MSGFSRTAALGSMNTGRRKEQPMTVSNRLALTIAIAAATVVVSVKTTRGQLPIPVQGQRGAEAPPAQPGQQGQRGQGGRGQRGQVAPPQDPPPVVSPVATASTEITGPGKFYETLMELKPGDN